MSMYKTYTLRVALNGTTTNPFAKWGLSHNPFPQIAKAEWDPYVMRVQELGGEPIPNTMYIREKLKGFHPEFIELCCRKFRKGEYVRFSIEWEA